MLRRDVRWKLSTVERDCGQHVRRRQSAGANAAAVDDCAVITLPHAARAPPPCQQSAIQPPTPQHYSNQHKNPTDAQPSWQSVLTTHQLTAVLSDDGA